MTPDLDDRFSDAHATAVPWDDAQRVLEGAQLAWITTVRTDGRPHVTPLVTVWLDGALHFCTGPDEQKGHNLNDDPRVAITTGCNTWNDGLDVVVEGDAVRVVDRPTLERLAEAWAAKWDGRWTFGVVEGGFSHGDTRDDHPDAPVYVFAVRPAKAIAFGKGTFSQTSYRAT